MSDIDCGDNSCLFATKKIGMRTNGGCRCFEGAGFSRSSVQSAMQMLPEILALRKELDEARASHKVEIAEARELAKRLIDNLTELRDEALLTRMTVNEVAVLATRESLERYFIESQNSARQCLKDNAEAIERLTKEK